MADKNIEPQLRAIILERLRVKRPIGEHLSVPNLIHEIAEYGRSNNLKILGHETMIKNGFKADKPSPHLVPRVRDIVWDLIVEGVIRPGRGDDNYQQDDIHVTSYGKEVLEGAANPYDPDGYVKLLTNVAPNADPAILAYIGESARALRANCLLSSTITLGLASEKALLLIIDAFRAALGATDKAQFDTDINAKWMIKSKYDRLMYWFTSKRTGLEGLCSSTAVTQFDDALRFLFPYFRDLRNAAGHPSAFLFEREQVHGNLVMFPGYLKRLCDLITLLGTTTTL